MSWDSIFAPAEKQMDKIFVSEIATLPELPKDILKWIDYARPIVDGNPRVILPMWEEIYRDNYPFKFILGSRQIFKSTYATDIVAFETTAFEGAQVGYITYDDISRSGFAKQRLQYGTFEVNPILKVFPRHKLGSVREISMRNGSTAYTFIDHNKYAQVEGKSLTHAIPDETQYLDIPNLNRVIHTMTTTQGKLTVLGIGGESGSDYENLWLSTDQREWVFDDPYWRAKLQYGFIKKKNKWGFIWGEYLKEVMRGHWEIPEHARGNTNFHGYHLPQTIFPHIPLTIADAMDPTKYNVHPRFSIEYKEQNSLQSEYISHVLGGFFNAERRPITPQLVQSCMNDYKYIRLLDPAEIAELKYTYGDRIRISMGVDWGSGSPSFTVVCIIVEWLGTNGSPSRYQIVYLDKRPKEDQMKQAERILQLFKEARCDMGIADLGHGQNQVKFIQDGGFSHFDGSPVQGLGARLFVGCRTIEDEDMPVNLKNKHIDEHGTTISEFRIDKSANIQNFINLMGARMTHPRYPNTPEYKRSRLIIPYIESGSYKQSWVIKDLCSTTRKDIEKLERNSGDPNPATFAKAQFNHPSDTLMSMIYSMIGFEKKSYTWFSV